MTEHLIEKQSMLERAKSENTALQIQLDNQKQQIQQLTVSTASAVKASLEEDIEEGSSVTQMRHRPSTTSNPPPLATLLPATFASEGYVSRKFVRAANLLDTLRLCSSIFDILTAILLTCSQYLCVHSAEIGNFLRRYPLARLFAIFYIVTTFYFRFSSYLYLNSLSPIY